jgi:hypothetical protein
MAAVEWNSFHWQPVVAGMGLSFLLSEAKNFMFFRGEGTPPTNGDSSLRCQ